MIFGEGIVFKNLFMIFLADIIVDLFHVHILILPGFHGHSTKRLF